MLERYFLSIENEVNRLYEVARAARSMGLDPTLDVEIPRAEDLAERVEGLVGPKGIAEEIRSLEKSIEHREILAVKIAEEIIEGKFGKMSEEEAVEQAIRTSLAIVTEARTAAAFLEGVTQVKIKRNQDGSRYLAIYYASPIRAAGGTAQVFSVLVGDYIRRKLYLSEYKPKEEEVERFIEEVELYQTEVTRLQYNPEPWEIRLTASHLPIEISGEPTEQIEVSGYRNLERVETNRLRGGAILVLVEGLIQKAPKVLKYVEELGLDGWDWIRKLIKDKKDEKGGEEEKSKKEKYLKEIIAGRPVLSHPNARGGFRLRYGRSRNTGFASVGIHPATMTVLNDFLAVGTQIKTERPGKGAIVTPVDGIEGPIVKLRDGSVLRLTTKEEAEKVKGKIEEILFLGDILIGYGEFKENNHPLLPSGYVEEWWINELRSEIAKLGISRISNKVGIKEERIREILSGSVPTEREAILLSKVVPLHPRYTYFWEELSVNEVKSLRRWLSKGSIEENRLIVPKSKEKRYLEVIGAPHRVSGDSVVLEEYEVLIELLRPWDDNDPEAKTSLEFIRLLSGIEVREKAPIRIGARMGRPEKAKPRKMSPPVHVLFPVGRSGGKTRDLILASKRPFKVEIVSKVCEKCGTRTYKNSCPNCSSRTITAYYCENCDRYFKRGEKCPICSSPMRPYSESTIDISKDIEESLRKFSANVTRIKGVIGMTSKNKVPEPIEKGVLRAKYDVYVFKDGTIRFDATNAPLTHFKPKEIGISVKKLKALGYRRDIYGEPLEREDQILELFPQDVILPIEAGKYLLRVSKFIDELLEKFYGLEAYYRAEKIEDLVGHLVIALAPHTSAGVIGRIIGFTEANVCYAHPYLHAAKRRNCDGDEDSVILALDALINFSRQFLPEKRGGTMDAPLIITTKVDPREVDDEVHNMDVCFSYPIEFYKYTWEMRSPSEVQIETVENRLGKGDQAYMGLGYTLDTSDISSGPRESKYKTLSTMEEKLFAQMELAEKIRAVDEHDVARRVLESHFLPDIKGNLTAFSKQRFRCVDCNRKYRRIPLTGKCDCGGKLVLTVSRGNVEKYLHLARLLTEKYEVGDYVKQRLKLAEISVRSVFEDEKSKQATLSDFLIQS